MKTDYDALGLAYDPPAVRVDRFEEALHVIKQCFTGEKFTYHGEHYRITDYASYPKPVQQPHLPILVGGGGKRVLSIAAREADIIGINPNLRAGEIGLDATKDSLQEQTDRKLEWIREAAGARIDRHRDPDAVLRRARSPTIAMKLAKALAPAFGVVARGGVGVGRGARRHRDRDHRAAAPPPRASGTSRTSWSATRTSTSSRRSSPSSPGPERRHSAQTRSGIHSYETLARSRRRLRVSRWPAPGKQHDLAVPGEHLHDLARLGRQDLVVGAVEQEQRRLAELRRDLAARPTASTA